MLEGRASGAGTRRYAERMAAQGLAEPAHYRNVGELSCSSVGLGTYLGDSDAKTDALYEEAFGEALSAGCNVVDSAINYRFQRSERSIGAALQDLVGSGRVRREELVVCTKGGFLSFDGEAPRDVRGWFQETFGKTGVATLADVVAGCHCMTPAYLRHQIAQSRANLGLDCLDVYYVHNPESQLDEIPREEFYRRLQSAFGVLEEEVRAGRLQAYGVATWDGFRVDPDAPTHLSLQDVCRAAAAAGGPGHHFRFIQLPFNLSMPEACVLANQTVDAPAGTSSAPAGTGAGGAGVSATAEGAPGRPMTVLAAAARLGVAVVASASLLQTRVLQHMPPAMAEYLPGLQTSAQRALQFVRSAPGVTTALVGMKNVSHVEENLRTVKVPPLDPAALARIFG